MKLEMETLETPLGETTIVSGPDGVCALGFEVDREGLYASLGPRSGVVELRHRSSTSDVAGRVAAYFAGDLHALDPVRVDAYGTPFQLTVWRALRSIPPGTSKSYGRLARELGRPGAARAVGLANSRNPVALIVPCHRVVGAGGDLTGYASGVWRKAWLLEHEGVRLATPLGASTARDADSRSRSTGRQAVLYNLSKPRPEAPKPGR